MNRTTWLVAALFSLGALAAPQANKAPAKAPEAPKAAAAAASSSPPETDFPQGPLGAGAKVGWAHAPFEDGDCSLCHEKKDPKSPGKIIMPVNDLCLSCHEEFSPVLGKPHVHKPTKKSCINCHNAHNAPEKKLLHAPVPKLCASCHDEMMGDIATAKVKHLAVERDQKCMNCHNPHSSNYERLLHKAPFDLCISCHDNDDVKDGNGKKLQNIGQLVKDNPKHHKPVAEKDCSACHAPHSSENFRLLVDPYPAEFYSAFEPAKYKLCFECHKSDIVNTKETTTLTRFRDGNKNLHYVHVNAAEGRGRTCRACHEVHASKQSHIIRDSVPFGPRGWLLKTNFHELPNGGSCDKTCHNAKTYVNRKEGEKEQPFSSLTASAAKNEAELNAKAGAKAETKAEVKPDPKADPKKPAEKK